MSKQRQKVHHDLLPYAIIQAATEGDADAISAVLQHYEGYIARLSLRPIRNPYGYTKLCIDEAMRRRLEIKLITSILAFRVA